MCKTSLEESNLGQRQIVMKNKNKNKKKMFKMLDEKMAKEVLDFLARRCGYDEMAVEHNHFTEQITVVLKTKDGIATHSDTVWTTDNLCHPTSYDPVRDMFYIFCKELAWPTAYLARHKHGCALAFILALSKDHLLVCSDPRECKTDDIVFLPKGSTLENVLVEMDLDPGKDSSTY